MGRPRKCKYVKNQHTSSIVEWFGKNTTTSNDFETPLDWQNDTTSELFEQYGLEKAIPYSENKNRLWELANNLKQQSDSPIALLELDPYCEAKNAQVWLATAGKARNFKTANYHSLLTEINLQPDVEAMPETGTPLESMMRNSSKKTYWHKTRRCPNKPQQQQQQQETGKKPGNRQSQENLSYMVISKAKMQFKNERYGPCSCGCELGSFDVLRNREAKWLKYLQYDFDSNNTTCAYYDEDYEEDDEAGPTVGSAPGLFTGAYEVKLENLIEPGALSHKQARKLKRVKSASESSNATTGSSSADEPEDESGMVIVPEKLFSSDEDLDDDWILVEE